MATSSRSRIPQSSTTPTPSPRFTDRATPKLPKDETSNLNNDETPEFTSDDTIEFTQDDDTTEPVKNDMIYLTAEEYIIFAQNRISVQKAIIEDTKKLAAHVLASLHEMRDLERRMYESLEAAQKQLAKEK